MRKDSKYMKALNLMIDRGEFSEGDIYDVSYSEARIQGQKGGLKNSTDKTVAPTITTTVENYAICVEVDE